MVRTRAEPFWLRDFYQWDEEVCSINGAKDETAIWSFRRIGQTATLFDDAFRIFIGGEHDDWYDPDFLIYNDVIVEGPTDEVYVYAYPKEVFPPTDFHSATLLDDDWIEDAEPYSYGPGILIVGGLGYVGAREFGKTPVYWLSLFNMAIMPIETTGENPGWIYGHQTMPLSETRILLAGGKALASKGDFAPNEARFELDLMTRTWSRVF